MDKTCPICKGTGHIKEPKLKGIIPKGNIVKLLHKNGYGIREIQRFMKYKSPHSVSYWLKK